MAVTNTTDFSGTGPGVERKIYDLSGGFTVDELKSTHATYQKYEDEWNFLQCAYDGARALIEYGALLRHERESNNNFTRRISEAYGFSYSRSIVDLFNFYLFKENVKRALGKLADDQQWLDFQEDCNLEGDDFNDFLLEAGRASSIQGHLGILVDKPTTKLENKEQELAKGVYPYLSMYKPLAILDWEYDRDIYGRPVLIYLKLKDDEDNLYRIWTPEMWQIWAESEVESSSSTVTGNQKAKLINEGVNPLGEIPWIWLYNGKTSERGYGYSDIGDIARIDASIIRNLSQGEEIINYAAFPMMRKPWEESKGGKHPDDVGVTAVLGFDPERPDTKPDWLDSSVLEPITAIFDKVIEKKIAEIYRSANIGGLQQTEVSTDAKSGTALKSEFQLLNGKLVKKGKSLERVEIDIIWYWLRWQKNEEWWEDVNIERSDTYEVENLAQDLDNIMTSTYIVTSKEFKRRIMKKVVRLILANEPDDEIAIIDEDIDEEIDNPVEFEDGYSPEEIDEGYFEEEEVDEEGNVVPFPKK